DQLLAADFWGRSQLDILYRCTVQQGTYTATDETSSHQWLGTDELPRLLPNQVHLLRKAGILA
ncbi:MAG TPA: hypothetical protein VFA49_03835, partial [Chloroflexota bacterium]|nr:hypothetical protein [Chloroflexota bacterium]